MLSIACFFWRNQEGGSETAASAAVIDVHKRRGVVGRRLRRGAILQRCQNRLSPVFLIDWLTTAVHTGDKDHYRGRIIS